MNHRVLAPSAVELLRDAHVIYDAISDLLVSRQVEPNISTFGLVFHFIEANDFYFYMYKTGSGMYCKHGSVYFLVCWCSLNETIINV